MALAGHKTVAIVGNAEQLGNQEIPEGSSVLIAPLPTNTGNVGINDSAGGASLALGTPFILPVSAQRVPVEVRNLNQIWVDAAIAGQGVMWIAVKA
jgi:hypothetical protein